MMLGRVPLFPLFLEGKATPTIPDKLPHLKGCVFQFGTANSAAIDSDGRRGSNVLEVNQWLWQFGRGRPHIGGLSVSETEGRHDSVNRAGLKRSHKTRCTSKAARGGDE